MIKAQVITVGASYEAQVSLLTRLGTHGGIGVLDHDSREMADVRVVLVGPDWAGSSPELAQLVTDMCRLEQRRRVPLCLVRERGEDWYMRMHESNIALAKDLCWFDAAPLDSERLVERIIEAARKQPATEAPDITALRVAAVWLRDAADKATAARWQIEKAPTPNVEAHSDRLAAIRGLEAMIRVQATSCDDAGAERRIELAIDSLGDEVEMPAHVAADVDRTIREALARGE